MDPQTGEYLLNGNFVVSMFQKTIQFGGTTIEYTGSDAVVERLNSSKPLKKDVVVQVNSKIKMDEVLCRKIQQRFNIFLYRSFQLAICIRRIFGTNTSSREPRVKSKLTNGNC